jgi:HlyD family secretion protein
MKKLLSHPFIKKTIAFSTAHRFITVGIAIVVFGAGWWAYGAVTSSAGETRYILGAVARGSVIATVSASGQVSALDQIDIKPKASGDITWVGVKAGDVVRAGQGIAQIDNTDAKQTIADAEQSLLQAKLQFQKDEAQAPIEYEQAIEALDDAKSDLATEYNDAYNTVSDTYLDLPAVMTGMEDVLYDDDLSTQQQWNVSVFRNAFNGGDGWTTIDIVADSAEKDYTTARKVYDASLLKYKSLSRSGSHETLEAFLSESIDTTTSVAEALQSEINLLDTYVDLLHKYNRTVPSAVTTMQSDARGHLSTVNSTLSALIAEVKVLDAAKKAIRDNERSIEILKIGNSSGDNPISLQSSKYSLADKERNLQELKDALLDYIIAAPFSGTLAALDVKRYDSVTTGTSVATLITNQRIATLSLNEVDVAKINVGDRATLTLDAIEELSLTGEVAEIDAVGTVSQGVVSYELKIAFDTQDERVKPGMTVNASIIIDAKQDVLTVPASAVKTQTGSSYVEVFDPALPEGVGNQGVVSNVPPTRVPVEIGLSDDTSVEIISGLQEGQQIVTRTSSGVTTPAAATTNARGGFGGPSGGIRL